jgi:hypothetical protein
MRTLRLPVHAELPPGDPAAVSISVSPRGRLFALSLSERLERARPKKKNAKPKPKSPERWLKVLDDGAWTAIPLPEDGQPIHFAEPLPGGGLLVVGARSSFRGPGNFDKNARSIDATGKLERAFLLGDGISNVQVTEDGQIWTGYFDEGVFGNRGWNDPIGAPGLLCWNSAGERIFEFDPGAAGTDDICDVYAMNIASNQDAWVYFYMDFALVRIRNQRSYTAWKCPVKGSHAFAVFGNLAFFSGGYDEPNLFRLYSLEKDGKMRRLETFSLADEEGEPLVQPMASARGAIMAVTSGQRVYRIDIRELDRGPGRRG